jgi:hypothetical protein
MPSEGARLSVSVIVPVHRWAESFPQRLDSLRAAEPATCEILVVADGAVAEDIRAGRAAGVRVIEMLDPVFANDPDCRAGWSEAKAGLAGR